MTNVISTDDVQAYLQRIVEAGIFEFGSRRYRLLDYLIQTEWDGRGDTLKAYTIGLDVFDKPDTFDPSTDSSIRVAIGRLRTALALFENSGDADIALIVDVPVGTYRPVLKRRRMETAPDPAPTLVTYNPKSPRKVTKGRLIWGATGFLTGIVLIAGLLLWFNARPANTTIALEIDNFRGDRALARQTSTSLRRVLSNNQAITVKSDDTAEQVADETDYILNGHVNRTLDGTVEVSVELVSADTNTILWAKAATFPDDALLQSRIAQIMGDELRIKIFSATKTELAKRDPHTLTPEQLFIMTTWAPGQIASAEEIELERIGLMEIALAKDPDFGSTHSVMASKLAYLANVNGSLDTDELRYQALAHGRRARELSPLNPDVMFNVALSLWHSGHIVASKAAMDRVVDLDQSNTIANFLSVLIPYTCSPPPDEIMEWAVTFEESLARDNPIRWLTLSWISGLHANRAEYEDALRVEEQASFIFEAPYSFMRHAMLLNKLGRTKDAADIVRLQEDNWPGLDPTHFAEVTQPRFCSEAEMYPQLIENYRELAVALDGEP